MCGLVEGGGCDWAAFGNPLSPFGSSHCVSRRFAHQSGAGARVKPVAVIVPITGKAARKWIGEVHRHLPKLQGALFAVALNDRGKMVGVGTAGNPPRVWQGTGRFVISRVAVLASPFEGAMGMEPWEAEYPVSSTHAAPYCSMIYGALCRAGKALGYQEAWSYTLWWEPGTSLKAAGFWNMGLTKGGEWDRPSRRREAAAQPDPKRRWVRPLTDEAKRRVAAPIVEAIVSFFRSLINLQQQRLAA